MLGRFSWHFIEFIKRKPLGSYIPTKVPTLIIVDKDNQFRTIVPLTEPTAVKCDSISEKLGAVKSRRSWKTALPGQMRSVCSTTMSQKQENFVIKSCFCYPFYHLFYHPSCHPSYRPFYHLFGLPCGRLGNDPCRPAYHDHPFGPRTHDCRGNHPSCRPFENLDRLFLGLSSNRAPLVCACRPTYPRCNCRAIERHFLTIRRIYRAGLAPGAHVSPHVLARRQLLGSSARSDPVPRPRWTLRLSSSKLPLDPTPRCAFAKATHVILGQIPGVASSRGAST